MVSEETALALLKRRQAALDQMVTQGGSRFDSKGALAKNSLHEIPTAVMEIVPQAGGPWKMKEARVGSPRRVRELLGHSDVKTTMIYTHVLNRGSRGMRSPADKLF